MGLPEYETRHAPEAIWAAAQTAITGIVIGGISASGLQIDEATKVSIGVLAGGVSRWVIGALLPSPQAVSGLAKKVRLWLTTSDGVRNDLLLDLAERFELPINHADVNPIIKLELESYT